MPSHPFLRMTLCTQKSTATETMKRIHILLAAVAVIIFSPNDSAFAQTTAFTYQGQLADNGVPADGDYDVRFSLHDADSAGNPVGSEITVAPLSVTDGLFTVTLDFGAAVFDGSPRWLEIAVRANGSVDDHVVLSPRQEITSAPYATLAMTAGTAATASNVSGANISGSISGTLITDGSVNSLKLADGAVGSTQLADGAVGSTQLADDLTLDGTTVIRGGLSLPATISATEGVITQNGSPLVHSFGSTTNFFAGPNAGNFDMTGPFNTATGASALKSNKTGGSNTASGVSALFSNTTDNANTASGAFALNSNETGLANTASGNSALESNTTGNFNIALGFEAGMNLTTGHNNIAVGNAGVAGESGIIRIGTSGTHTDTFLTGVIHGDGSGLTGLTASSLADGAVGSTQLADGAVGSTQLADGAVGNTQLADDLTLDGVTFLSGGLSLPATTSATGGVVTQDGNPPRPTA